MATLRELIIKISANSTSFQSEIARASRMGENYYRTMEQGSRRAESASRQSQRAIADLNGQLSGISDTAKDMAGVFAGAFATGHLINLADEWNQLNARLKQASQSTSDFSNNQKALMDISQATGTAFGDNASLFARSAASMREFGYSSQDVLKITESVSTGLKLSGASAEESSSVITQFSQALAQGVLRGEEFNAVNEAGDRVIRALAAGMGVARKDLKGMADQGQLTIDKVVPALISQLGTLRGEFASLPASVSGSVTKVENAFQAWVGAQNQASGVTASLSGLLDGLAGNMNTVASTLGVLVGIGAVRFFGNMASSVGSATTQMIAAQRSEVALAAAQVRGTQVSTARARAAVYRAQQAKAAAVSADQQTAAERRLTAAQAQLTRNMAAREAAQNRLNSITSVGTRLMGGLLGAVGGLPGILLGAGAIWLYMAQKTEQARKEAQEYAKTIEDIRQKTSSMQLPDTADNISSAQKAYNEQNRLIEEQQKKVKALKNDIETLNQAKNNPAYNGYVKDTDLINTATAVTAKLAVEQERLNQMLAKSQEIQGVLEGLENRRIALIREQAAEQNKSYQSLLMMNGQHTEFNRLLSLGNNLLQSRAGLVNSPMRVPQADISTKDQDSLQLKQQQAELAGLTGVAKVLKQAQFELKKMGRDGVENAGYAAQYTKALVDEFNNTERLSQAKKSVSSATKEQNKAEREAASLTEQYTRKMADLSIAIEVQKVRASQGEKAAELYAASHQAGVKWTDEYIKSIRASSVELETWTQKADAVVKKQREQADALKDLTDAARKYNDETALITKSAGMSDRQRSYFDEKQQINRVFDQAGGEGNSQAAAAQLSAMNALDQKYKAMAASEADWSAGISKGYNNWVESVSNISGTVSQGIESTMGSALDNTAAMLTGSKADWKDWGLSALQMIAKVGLQMAIMSAMGKGSALGGIFTTVASGIGSAFAGGAAGSANNAFSSGSYSGLALNAKGGVYNSPDLSSYSGSIVDSPTYFAFAKGAGLMGEAGPEAIMPLTRAANGSLGVRAVSGGGTNVSTPGNVNIKVDAPVTIMNNGEGGGVSSAGASNTANQLKGIVQQVISDRLRQEISPGGLLYKG